MAPRVEPTHRQLYPATRKELSKLGKPLRRLIAAAVTLPERIPWLGGVKKLVRDENDWRIRVGDCANEGGGLVLVFLHPLGAAFRRTKSSRGLGKLPPTWPLVEYLHKHGQRPTRPGMTAAMEMTQK